MRNVLLYWLSGGIVMLLSAVRSNDADSAFKNQDEETMGGYYEEEGEPPRLKSGISTIHPEVCLFYGVNHKFLV